MIQAKDLVDQTGKPGLHPVLLCDECGMTCSANAGNYLLLPADHVLKHCGEPMRLVRIRRVAEDVELLPQVTEPARGSR